jgi:predicted  nucleic acid-binding Zn-ribbon protein
MPHQCVKCGTFYEDGSNEILKGCSNCGGKLFFYVKKGKEEMMKEKKQVELSKEDRAQIEEDVYDIIGNEIDRNKPVVLDIESIKILKPGKYELDLVHLFKDKEPLVYRLEDGKYMVDLIETFKKLGKQK